MEINRFHLFGLIIIHNPPPLVKLQKKDSLFFAKDGWYKSEKYAILILIIYKSEFSERQYHFYGAL